MQDLLLWTAQHAGASLALLFSINIALVAAMIILENRAPEHSHGWLLVLFAFPVVGFILYLFFGHNWHRKSGKTKRKIHEEVLYWRENAKRDLPYLSDRPTIEQHLRSLTTTVTGLRPTGGNTIRILTDGIRAFPDLIQALKSATTSIDLEFYIFHYDTVGKQIIDILKERAKAGVHVRLLVDGYGSIGFGAKAFKELRSSGVYAQYFAPLITFLYFFKINYRDHRKIAIIDNQIAYTGGMNIGDEYLRDTWRDTMIRIEGQAVKQFTRIFERSWRLSTTKAHAEALPAENIPSLTQDSILSIIPSGPDTEWFAIQRVYLELIHGAEKQLIIQTPYFVPDASIQEALINAALRGIDVQIVLPKKTDSPIVRLISMTYLGDLLRAGARVFEYHSGFLHQKIVIADGKIATVGTCNIDIRSFRLDFEVNVLLSEKQAIQHLLEDITSDIQHSVELTHGAYMQRSPITRSIESIARLIAPLV